MENSDVALPEFSVHCIWIFVVLLVGNTMQVPSEQMRKSQTMKRRVFIVDDHPVVRWGYSSIISREPTLEVCGEAASGEEALENIPAADPDLVIVDVTMEGMNGIELIEHLQSRGLDMPVLVISVHDETLYAERSLEAGAMGYIMKDEASEKIIDAIEEILDGGLYVSDKINANLLLRSVGRTVKNQSSLEQLSNRELEVFELIGQGMTTEEIADTLYISPKTVGTHRRQIQDKLGISTTAKLQQRAVLWVAREGAG